jgi:WD40 repeat protein
MKCSPVGDRIASGSMDTIIRLWDAGTACRRSFTGHTSTIFSIAYSYQGDLIASGSAEKSVRLWRVESDCQRIFLVIPNIGSTVLRSRLREIWLLLPVRIPQCGYGM